MDLLTWTRKGKDSNIYCIYIHRYIYIDWYVTQKSKVWRVCWYFFVTATATATTYYYCCYCLCVCVLPLQTVCCCYDKKNRLLEHNTYLTLPYLTHLFLSDSDKIYRDSSSIHRLVSRNERLFWKTTKKSPSEQISNLPENSLESITIQIQFSKYSRRALEKTFSLWWLLWWLLLLSESRAKPNRIYQSSRRKFTFLRSNLHTNTKKKKEEDKKNNNIKTMTHHRMGFTPSTSTTSSSSSSSTTKPSATTTKKPPQRACLGGMVITPCEKCTIRTYVSLSLPLSLYPIHHHFYPYPIPLLLLPFPSSDCIEYHTRKGNTENRLTLF